MQKTVLRSFATSSGLVCSLGTLSVDKNATQGEHDKLQNETEVVEALLQEEVKIMNQIKMTLMIMLQTADKCEGVGNAIEQGIMNLQVWLNEWKNTQYKAKKRKTLRTTAL